MRPTGKLHLVDKTAVSGVRVDSTSLMPAYASRLSGEEVTNLVAYLASPLAHFVNGSMIEIDGGQQKPLMDQARG